jgi:centromere protein C
MAPPQRGPPLPRQRGLYITRRETPALDSFSTTRSGRTVIPPISYWKNEAIVYGEDEGTLVNGVYVPSIKEVIRRDEVVPEKTRSGPKGKGGREGRPRKAKQVESEDEEEEADEDMEEWELSAGKLTGPIRIWNPSDVTGASSPEAIEELAYSAGSIIPRAITGSGAKFAKTLTMSFCGSGVIELPAGAVKKPKNCRRMQMCMFVHEGRVTVTVNGNTFSLGKGGMFQVPRGMHCRCEFVMRQSVMLISCVTGNFYSLLNEHKKTAKIFFTQAQETFFAPEEQE